MKRKPATMKKTAVLRKQVIRAGIGLTSGETNSAPPLERPSIGILLCATKDNEVVEYALSRSLSPALIAEYQTALPDKQLLQRKLHEFYQLALPTTEAPKARQRTARRP